MADVSLTAATERHRLDLQARDAAERAGGLAPAPPPPPPRPSRPERLDRPDPSKLGRGSGTGGDRAA